MKTRLKWIGLLAIAANFFLSACNDKKRNETGPPPPLKKKPATKGKAHHDDHDSHHETSSNKNPPVTLPAYGHLGAKFTLKKETPFIKILKTPEKYKEKTVLVSGKVEAMCHHRRGWFALSNEGKKPWLRVVTAPKFFIHKTAIGMKGRAEGVVKTRKISVKAAKHFAKTHKMFGGDPSKITEPQVQVILYSTGAQFTK